MIQHSEEIHKAKIESNMKRDKTVRHETQCSVMNLQK